MNREIVLEAVLKELEDILGLSRDEMEQNLDLDLLREGIIDSLSVVELLSCMESDLKVRIPITKLEPSDISSINSIVAAIIRTAEPR
ncbi:MAG: D-alanine--poly(phosphoribitol) ligase subunit 2 [Oscillospiraceae bacterium]|nr:D-alanine--poly(phosphoribitol) ligase subunit 2 [Oscillospiraceae bacterium]